MPSKLADYYGMGGVVLAITPRGSSTEGIVKKYGGIIAYPDDPSELGHFIQELIEEKVYSGRVLTGRGDPAKILDFESTCISSRLIKEISILPGQNHGVSF
jgi:hypothetical protein